MFRRICIAISRGQLKCGGTCAETRFRLSAKGTSPFKSAGGRGARQFSRLLTAEVCASAVVMLDTACSEVVWRVLATHSIRQFALHFPSCALPCAITFQLESILTDSLEEAGMCIAVCFRISIQMLHYVIKNGNAVIKCMPYFPNTNFRKICVWYKDISFIPLACAQCDDSLPFSGASSIPLCYELFPATLLHHLFFHPLSPHLPSISWSTSQSCFSQIQI